MGKRVDRPSGQSTGRVASGRVSRGDSTLHGVHSPGRVAARGVHSPRGGGPLGAASRPGRRSTRPGESTAASTCAAATFSADPSYPFIYTVCRTHTRSGARAARARTPPRAHICDMRYVENTGSQGSANGFGQRRP